MARVFISYSFGDKAVADRLSTLLSERGASCWIAPRDITPGANFPDAIVSAIEECPFLLLVFTAKSNRSPHVSSEVGIAFGGSRELILLELDDTMPSNTIRYYFHNKQWLDGSAEQLAECADRIAAVVNGSAVTAVEPLAHGWKPRAVDAVKAAPELELLDVGALVQRALSEAGIDTRLSTPRDANSRLVWSEYLEKLQGHDIPELCHVLRQPDSAWETRFKALHLMRHTIYHPAGGWLIPVAIPAALSQLGLSELREAVFEMIANVDAEPAEKWQWLMTALPHLSDAMIAMLVRVTPEGKRAETGRAIVRQLEAKGGRYPLFAALKDLDYRDAAPVLRAFVRRGDWTGDASRLLALWRDREAGGAIRAAIDAIRDDPNRAAEVRELLKELYTLERGECAAFAADLLENGARKLQEYLLQGGSPVFEREPALGVVRALSTSSPSATVREACARILNA
ncbi:MAG: toll/interleukin-1 receptor domain-containing protein [Bryobacteraceae bacterium]